MMIHPTDMPIILQIRMTRALGSQEFRFEGMICSIILVIIL